MTNWNERMDGVNKSWLWVSCQAQIKGLDPSLDINHRASYLFIFYPNIQYSRSLQTSLSMYL